MSIQPISTAFRNISVPFTVQDEFWVNTQGFTTNATGTNLTFPGVYPQGSTILSVSPLTPGLNSQGQTLTANYQILALNNAGAPLFLYTGSRAGVQVGPGLGSTLPADSWLTMQLLDGNMPTFYTGQSMGVNVRYTTLTQQRLLNSTSTNYPQS